MITALISVLGPRSRMNYSFFPLPPQFIELSPVIAQLIAEILHPVKSLLLFLRNQFFLREGGVVVHGSIQRGQRRGNLACNRSVWWELVNSKLRDAP